MTLAPFTICELYRSRWQVELFFKWIKQHLRIKRFFGTAKIVPIAISGHSRHADWDRAVAVLRALVGPRDLIIQSTDYSHYLPLGVAVEVDAIVAIKS